MKIPITDQFLWDVYKFLEKSGDAANFIFNSRQTLINEFKTYNNPVIEKYIKDKNQRKFRQMIYRLKRNNFIKVKNLQGNQAIVLTKKGEDKALRAQFKIQDNEKQKRKDGKWTMLIFDVPEKYRKSRDLLRSILYNLGFKLFQQSAWVTPYDVAEKLEEALQMYSLDEFVKIFLIEEIK